MKEQKTILISIDGLRGDFVDVYDEGIVPNLRKLVAEGSYASNVMNQFCSLTLPNHISIATGLHAQNHGFVSNCMFDPEMQEMWTSWRYYNEHKSEDHEKETKIRRWWDFGLAYPGEPIWQTATRHGLKCGIYEWPAACGLYGSDAPAKLVVNDGEISIFERIDIILSWMNPADGQDACDFVAFYIPELDTIEHDDGPFGAKTKEVLKTIDSGLGYLIEQLKAKNLWTSMNLIITSDHGHIEMDPERIVSLDRHLDKKMYLHKDLSYWPIGCSADALHARLEAIPHCRVYWREELGKVHYNEHHRIGPIVVVPDPGAFLVRESDLVKTWSGKGNHGYDPYECREMRPPLICIGPSVKPAVKMTGHVDQTDIYLLLCHTLGLRPAPCNGDIARINDILID